MTQFKIKRLRNGQKATIYCEDAPGMYPIHGRTDSVNGVILQWGKNGRYMSSQEDEFDIIDDWEEPEPRRLAYVRNDGFVRLVKTENELSLRNEWSRAPWLDEPEAK